MAPIALLPVLVYSGLNFDYEMNKQ